MTQYRNVDRVKCVAVGDGAVGKTSLLITFTENRFPEEYIPTVFENYISSVDIDGNEISASLWDTAGQEELASLRSLSYPDTDIFLLCFSLVDESSLTSAYEKWYPEITERCPEARLFIVGTKLDLKQCAPDAAHIPTREAIDEFCKRIGAMGYRECSAKTNDGVAGVFEDAVRAAMVILETNVPMDDPTPRKKTKGKKEKERDNRDSATHAPSSSITNGIPPPMSPAGKSPRPSTNLSGSNQGDQTGSGSNTSLTAATQAQPEPSNAIVVRKKNSKCAIL
eukprot:TRINITY_DN9711_c0_g1_i1.p1 TRINITY_DN9711_c0_g1~~TRINITY_DN9711_c0_g1_i1.p1  ORF type:complete len:281 (+),score=51.09 TRINITY_DN9711_c0_g1_i1:155-997(+)